MERADMFDYHVHTEFSDDSVYPMEQAVLDAIEKGIEEICFTDHVDYGIKKDWDCGEPIVYRGGEPLANVNYPAGDGIWHSNAYNPMLSGAYSKISL